jgi:hypothetical protein
LNASFYKTNQNKKGVSYLNDNLEISNITEIKFINFIKANIIKLGIELFSIFKTEFTTEQLIDYMINLVNVQNNYDKKEYIDDISVSMDDLFRNDEIKMKLEKTIQYIKKTPELKQTLENNLEERKKLQDKTVCEYYNSNIELEDEKNLNKIRNEANSKITAIELQAFQTNYNIEQ